MKAGDRVWVKATLVPWDATRMWAWVGPWMGTVSWGEVIYDGEGLAYIQAEVLGVDDPLVEIRVKGEAISVPVVWVSHKVIR